MIYTLDRFEGDYAVLLLRPDEEEQMDVLVKHLPSNLKEGDILEIDFTSDGKVSSVRVLEKETNQARKRAEDLIQKLLNKNTDQ